MYDDFSIELYATETELTPKEETTPQQTGLKETITTQPAGKVTWDELLQCESALTSADSSKAQIIIPFMPRACRQFSFLQKVKPDLGTPPSITLKMPHGQNIMSSLV